MPNGQFSQQPQQLHQQYQQAPLNQQQQHQQFQQQQQYQQSYNNSTNVDPFLKGVNPEMLQFGFNTGKELLVKQKEKWLPGVSGFWVSLKIYFAVSNHYVVKKLIILMYPIGNKNWIRIRNDEQFPQEPLSPSSSEAYLIAHKFALPKHDQNAPDLYIPLMSFITYVLLFGLRKGLDSGFTPEVLIQAIWRCLILHTCECLLIKFGLSLMHFTLPFLDIFSYTGYKYVALCLTMVSRIFGTTISFLTSVYMSVMLGYFVLKSLAAVVPAQVTTTFPPRHLMLLFFATLQCFVAFVLCFL